MRAYGKFSLPLTALQAAKDLKYQSVVDVMIANGAK
jgi:hypothetical protein